MNVIPIQRTAVSRRVHKLRGSGGATQGRPRKGQTLKRQLNIDENDEGTLTHKLPGMKKRRKVAKHSLMQTIYEKTKNVNS